MGIVSTILAGKGDISLSDFNRWMDQQFSGIPTAAGVDVTEEGSLSLVPVFACIRLLANTIASLPFPLYRYTTGGGKARAWDHPLYPVIHDAPNPEMSSFDFWSAAVAHLELWGNHYSEIERSNGGGIRGLWPLDPRRMKADHWGEDGRLVYKYRLPEGGDKFFHSSLILHIRGFGSNGITGYGPIALARQSIGLTKAMEEYGARFFGNDSTPGGVLSVEGTLKKEGREALKESWEDAFRPLSNKRRIAVLDAGAKYQAVSVPNEDAQFLESRKFQRSEIAMLFGIPPHMIGDVERTTSWGSGIEQQNIGFAQYALTPRLEMIEQQVNLTLLSPQERRAFFAEHVLDGLLRGDSQTRHESYQKGIQNGYYSINDILRLENRNTIGPEGDRRWVNGNMVPIDQVRLALQPGGNGRASHLWQIVREAAAKVVRKELAAMGKAAERSADPAAWEAAVDRFYGAHAEIVARDLRLEPAMAAAYVAEQRASLLSDGPAAMEDWSWRRVNDLVDMTIGGRNADANA